MRIVKFTKPVKEAACFLKEASDCIQRGDSSFTTKKKQRVYAHEEVKQHDLHCHRQ